MMCWTYAVLLLLVSILCCYFSLSPDVQWFIHLRAHGQGKGDDPPRAPPNPSRPGLLYRYLTGDLWFTFLSLALSYFYLATRISVLSTAIALALFFEVEVEPFAMLFTEPHAMVYVSVLLHV